MSAVTRIVAKQGAKQIKRLGETGMRRGAGGNGLWLAAGLVVSGVRLVGRLGERKREVVYSEILKPGETINVRHLLEDRKGRPAG